MKTLFFTINDHVNMDKNYNFSALIEDENKVVLNSMVKTLETDKGDILEILSKDYESIITFNNKMKKELLETFSDNKELLKVIEEINCIENLLIDSCDNLHHVNNISLGQLVLGYDILKPDIEDELEDVYNLMNVYNAFKINEIFNLEVLSVNNKHNNLKKNSINLLREAKTSIYVDFEFDIENRQKAEFISIGAVVTLDGVKIKDSFYSLINTVNKKNLSKTCMEITHLTQDEVDNADNLKDVMNKFALWINKYLRNGIIYNWGNFDKVALSKILKGNGLGFIYNKIFKKMYDIQVEISENLTLNNEVISKCIGLEKMKEMYNISGKVKHNALDDAIDLMKVVHAYKNYDYDPLILRKMYKEAMRKTFLWNYNFTNKDYSITYSIVCFIKSLKADIPIDELKKTYKKIKFNLVKDIPMEFVICFLSNDDIKKYVLKVDYDRRDLIKSFVKIDLPEIIEQKIII